MASERMFDDSIIIEDYFASPLKSGHENPTTTTENINLVCLGNEFSWEGTLDGLKAFIQNDLELEGNWSSPGGDVKVYTGPKYTINGMEDLKRSLGSFAMIVTKTYCCCRELADEVKRIEGDIKLLKNGVKTHEANETLQCCMGACKNEETRLRDYLEAANATIKDLTPKVQNLESEKSSLLTTIIIIQEDNSQRTNNMHTEKDPHKNAWVEVKNNKKKKHKQNAKQKEQQNEPPIRSDAEKLVAKTNVVCGKKPEAHHQRQLDQAIRPKMMRTSTLREAIQALSQQE
ncbi:Hypothetical predicted protein [Paramuricea clavata]|uniref:Uncharacterized protein n=1 Tax=Paramuricea clavata TaxID=317549 RepID=A0A6S7GVU7_PARCT|nr:Hypothetical predicted protein [Paramuricea clavata]